MQSLRSLHMLLVVVKVVFLKTNQTNSRSNVDLYLGGYCIPITPRARRRVESLESRGYRRTSRRDTHTGLYFIFF
jgi:hypothetical protein